MARNIRIGGVRVDFTGDASQFVRASRRTGGALRRQQQDVRRLRSDLRRFNNTVRSTVRQYTSLRNAIVGFSAAGLFGGAIVQSSRLGASLVELSQRIGVTVEELQLLQRVFSGEGVTSQQLERALLRLSEASLEAQEGTGTYGAVLERLGVQVQDAEGRLRPVFEVMLEAADGFARIDNQAERAALGVELFGARNAATINVLQRGSRELRASIEEFRRLGLVSTESGVQLKALDQTLTNLRTSIEVGFAQAVGQSADSIQVIARHA